MALTPEQQAAIDRATARVQTRKSGGLAQTTKDVAKTGYNYLAELAAGANRSIADIVDFLGPNAVNSILQLSGSEIRMPTARETLQKVGIAPEKGAFTPPGLAQDIVAGIGEAVPMTMGAQGLIRGASRAMPVRQVPGTPQPTRFPIQRETGRRVLEQFAELTPAAEAAYTAGAVTGGELGEATGVPGAGFVGSFLFTPTVALGKKGLSYALENISDLTNMASNLTSVSRDLAAETLAKAMISEGMTPQDVLRRMEQLGPEAIPADVNQSFREILRAASNYSPFVTGEARQVLAGRQQGAGQRIQNALNLTFPGTVDDFIESVDNQMSPQIRQLYDQASQNPIQMSERLRNMIVGESSMGRAAREAERRLLDKRAAGDKVSNFDLVDETKKVLDDQIGAALREGKRNEARNLIRLRNVLVQEADAAVPEYAQARQMYAGRAAISDAADIGGEFFQTPRRELIDLASGMTQIEKTAYTLSAKEAILDRIDNTGMNRDQVAALFGKNGDVAKLRTLFDNEAQFNNFTKALRRETDFLLTRRTVLENSTTTKQMQQMQQVLKPQGGYQQVIQRTMSLFSNPQLLAAQGASIIDGLKAEKGSDAYINALMYAGDILLTRGMDPRRLEEMLNRGKTDVIARSIEGITMRPMPIRTGTVLGMGSAQTTGEQ